MSYSALTELGEDPICPACKKEITDGDTIALILVTKAKVVESYNEENELAPLTFTADLDWTDEVAFHLDCVKKAAAGILGRLG
jgi:hypothetical protein